MTRFRRAGDLLARDTVVDEIAHACGYYDQSELG
jgi:hypothetical protein